MDMCVASRRLGACLLAVLSLAGSAQAASKASALSIRVLSSPPGLIRGGDALIEVWGAAKGVKMTLNGQDVSGDLKLDPVSHTQRGLVGGLTVGKNTLRASAGAAKAVLILTDYPITGPILSGPHIMPYECRTEESGAARQRPAPTISIGPQAEPSNPSRARPSIRQTSRPQPSTAQACRMWSEWSPGL